MKYHSLRSVDIFMQQPFCCITREANLKNQQQYLFVQGFAESVVNIRIVQTLQTLAVFAFLYRTI